MGACKAGWEMGRGLLAGLLLLPWDTVRGVAVAVTGWGSINNTVGRPGAAGGGAWGGHLRKTHPGHRDTQGRRATRHRHGDTWGQEDAKGGNGRLETQRRTHPEKWGLVGRALESNLRGWAHRRALLGGGWGVW